MNVLALFGLGQTELLILGAVAMLALIVAGIFGAVLLVVVRR